MAGSGSGGSSSKPKAVKSTPTPTESSPSGIMPVLGLFLLGTIIYAIIQAL